MFRAKPLQPKKRKLINDLMETKNISLNEARFRDLKWLNEHYGFSKTSKKKELIKNLIPLRNKLCKLRDISDNNYEEECPICLCKISQTNLFITECAHVFCNNCIVVHIIMSNEFCPMCRSTCTFDDVARHYDDKYVHDLLERNGIMRITQAILDTGLVSLENMNYSIRNRFIWDPQLIMRIRQHKSNQNTIVVIVTIVFIIQFLIYIYPTIRIFNF